MPRPAPSPPWLRKLAQAIRLRCLDGLGRRWVVAVSGGSDSVAMLRSLHAIGPRIGGLTLSVAHLDHGTRPEAAEEAAFVADLAARLGLPCDLGRWSPGRPAHFEADARKARYDWLVEVAQRRGAEVVAVGHTRDDQAETILHRLIRGTGPRGLVGMAKARVLIDHIVLFRPMLGVGREALRDHLKSLDQPWRDDPTNDDVAHQTRARIRHELMPKLREFNPNVVEAIDRLGGLARGAMDAVDGRVEAIAPGIVTHRDESRIVVDRDRLAACPAFVRAEVLRKAWRDALWPEAAMDAARWRRLASWAVRGMGRREIGAGVAVVLRPREMILERVREPSGAVEPDPARLAVPGAVGWPGGRVVAAINPAGDQDGERLDLDRLVLPLRVDRPRPGDRFDPLGLGGHTMALADFFRGRRVARADRARVPVVRDALGIVWVVGHRIGHRARLRVETRCVLGLRWEPCTDPPEPSDAP